MPDLGVSDNLSGMLAKIQQATSAATSAQNTATAAQADAATARTDATAAQTQAAGAMTAQIAAVAAMANKVQRVVVTTPALTVLASSQDVTVTWPVAFADTNYEVIPTPWVNATTLGKFIAQPKAGTQTTTGCVITVSSSGLAIAAGQIVGVLAVHP